MDKVMEIVNIIKGVLENAAQYVSAVDAVLVALIALCLLIPGEQPEKFLRQVADLLAKVSRKPKE